MGWSGDRGDFRVVNDFARETGWLHQPMEILATWGIVAVVLVWVVAYWRARTGADDRRVVRLLVAPIGVLAAVAINQPIVSAVSEPRPFVGMQHVLQLVGHAPDPGFPSDHAVALGAAVVGLWSVRRTAGIVAMIVALSVCFARVYVGVHYPVDVVAGLALGALVALLVDPLGRIALTPIVHSLIRTRLRPVLLASRPVPIPRPAPLVRSGRD